MPSINTLIPRPTSVETALVCQPEELSVRPSTLFSILGIENLDHRDQARALHTVQRSMNALITTNPSASGLAEMAIEAKDAINWVDLNKQPATSAKRGETAKAALTQPAPSLPPTAHRTLVEMWGLIVFAHWQAEVPIPDVLSTGWRKLAESRYSDWKTLAHQSLSNIEGIEGAIQAGLSAVCTAFLHLLLRLQKEITFATPKFSCVPQLLLPQANRSTEVVFQPEIKRQEPIDTDPAGSTSITAPEDEPNFDAESHVNVEGHFISWQLVASTYLAGLDGYGLPHRWQALHPQELIRCCKRLTPLLTSTNKSQRLLAATCFSGLFLGLPPTLTAQVRFYETGDTWIDLAAGCIKRNLGAITNRTVSSNEQETCWRPIYLPPQVAGVLRELREGCKCAETIGDLLGHFKLTMRDIYVALNRGDQSSHRPELARFTGSLGLFLVSNATNPTVAAQVSGDWSLCPVADHHYLFANDEIFLKATTIFCDAVGLQQPTSPLTNNAVGSPFFGSIDEIKEIFKAISKEAANIKAKLPSRSRPADFIHFQNFFQLACALEFVFLTHHRATRVLDAKPNHIDLIARLALVNDKESDEYSARRIVPLVDELVSTLESLLKHQKVVILHMKKLEAQDEIRINADFKSVTHRHLFYQIKVNNRTKRYFASPIQTSDLTEFLKLFTKLPINFGRHFGFTSMILRGTAAPAINAATGRHISGAETFGILGSLSPIDICAYLRAEFEAIFRPLEIAPLTGLGSSRTGASRWKPGQPPKQVSPPKNDYLKARLDAQDLQPTMQIHTQRCPFSEETLEGHSYISMLRRSFTKTDLSGIDAATAVLFCLIVFDMVVQKTELFTLFNAMLSAPIRVAKAHFAEHQEKSYVLASRVVSPITAACVIRLKSQGTTVSRGYSLSSLAELLTKLDPGFVCPESVDLWVWLMTSTMHFCLVSTAPTESFVVFAGARSLAAVDVARFVYQRPAKETLTVRGVRVTRKQRDLKTLVGYLRRFADKHRPLGQDERRKKRLISLVLTLMNRIPNQFSGYYWACSWVLMECKEPITNQLGVSTIYHYLCILLHLFSDQLLFTNFDYEDWIYHRSIMVKGRSSEAISDVEGALLHLGVFARSKGFEVPKYFFRSKSTLDKVALRQPIIIFNHEVASGISQLASLDVKWKAQAAVKLRFLADAGTRPIEATNLRAMDVSADGELAHITTGGFDHLKTDFTRGSISISDPALRMSIVQLRRIQIATNSSGHQPLIFRELNDDKTEEIDAAITRSLRVVTGRYSLTLRDLRATGITKSICRLEALLTILTSQYVMPNVPLTTSDVNTRSLDMSATVRRARHSMSFLTTQRSYDSSASIRLAIALRQQESDLELGSCFIASMLGKTTSAIDVARLRAGCGVGQKIQSWEFFGRLLQPALETISEPSLAEKLKPISSDHSPGLTDATVKAALLYLYGLDVEMIVHLTGATPMHVKEFSESLEWDLGHSARRVFSGAAPHRMPYLVTTDEAIEAWKNIFSRRESISKLRPLLATNLQKPGPLKCSSLTEARSVATVLQSCMPSKWSVVLSAPTRVGLAHRSSLRQELEPLGIRLDSRVSDRATYWSISISPSAQQRSSPRVIGDISKFIFRAATAVLFYPSQKKD